MKIFDTVEEYIFFIAGERPSFLSSQQYSLGTWSMVGSFASSKSKINLARYDVPVIHNFVRQIGARVGFTARQAELAHTIIVKYKKQLAKLNVDIEPVANNSVKLLLPIRKIDYARTVDVENDQIKIRFPFDATLVQKIRSFSKDDSQGKAEWDHKIREWQVALTEYNTSWIVEHLVSDGFKQTKSFVEYINLCNEVNEHNMSPVLKLKQPDQLYIEHGNASLNKYIINNVGGFHLNNLIRLVDYAGICKYYVDESLLESIPKNVQPYMLNHMVEIPKPDKNSYQDLLDYVKLSNRLPVVIFDPSLKRLGNIHDQLTTIISKENIIVLDVKPAEQLTQMDTIPLLVTNSGLIRSGTTRQRIFQMAERIVFFYEAEGRHRG